MSLKGRLDRLERRVAAPSCSLWDVLVGEAGPDDLDDEAREILHQMTTPRVYKPGEKHRLEGCPVLAALRAEWARLGMPDPGDANAYEAIDNDPGLIEEVLRLAALPAPNGRTNERASHNGGVHHE